MTEFIALLNKLSPAIPKANELSQDRNQRQQHNPYTYYKLENVEVYIYL